MESIRIADKVIGESSPPFIIGEMSGNHNGDLDRALQIVDAVANAGADALKIQTYTADTITIRSDRPEFRLDDAHGLWGGETLYDLYSKAYTPWEWHAPIFERARSRGLVPFSSPFDATAVDFLEALDVDLYKIASLEIGDVDLLERVAKTGKPIILSDGSATLADIELAVQTIRGAGNDKVVLLSCTSAYPADPSDSNLRSIPVLSQAFDIHVGLSDHTLGIGAAIAATALGARVIEKHVTLARSEGGVDSAFSLEPSELEQLVEGTKVAHESLGSARLGAIADNESTTRALRRSLYVVQDVKMGDLVSRENVRSIRPSGGLEPRFYGEVLGQPFAKDAEAGEPLTWGHL